MQYELSVKVVVDSDEYSESIEEIVEYAIREGIEDEPTLSLKLLRVVKD